MCYLKRVIIYLLTVLSVGYGAVDIKKYFKLCDRNSVDINDCLVDAVQKGIAVMINGIEDLRIQPIDPYFEKDLHLEYKNNQISAKMDLINVTVKGLKSATVHDARLKADDDRFHLEIDMTSPSVSVKGEYSGEGQFNALKISADGEFNTTLTDLVYIWKLDGVTEKNGTETYVRINEFYMRPDISKLVVDLSNNNPETKDLIDLGITFVNQNWRTLYRELVPYAQANWNKQGIRIANKIFLKVPFNQLFPASS